MFEVNKRTPLDKIKDAPLYKTLKSFIDSMINEVKVVATVLKNRKVLHGALVKTNKEMSEQDKKINEYKDYITRTDRNTRVMYNMPLKEFDDKSNLLGVMVDTLPSAIPAIKMKRPEHSNPAPKQDDNNSNDNTFVGVAVGALMVASAMNNEPVKNDRSNDCVTEVNPSSFDTSSCGSSSSSSDCGSSSSSDCGGY